MNNSATLPYKYQFDKEDLEAIRRCNAEHGFAIVKGMLPLEVVEELKGEVRKYLEPLFTSDQIFTQTAITFIEQSAVYARLLKNESIINLARALHNNQPITLNRSAAIYKKPGSSAHVANSGAQAWHSDWGPLIHPYRANEALNNSGADSFWFYLTGVKPENGGLALIPDSHTEDWEGPEGFEFTDNRRSFYRIGAEKAPHKDMDVPGMLPLYADPGDMVVFSERTYHGVYPHQGTEPRLSCAISFRPKSYVLEQSWELPESAQRFIESCPPEVKGLVEGYTGYSTSWTSSHI